MLLRSDARRSREDYLDIALSLPFQNDTSTGMGIVVKGYCDAVWHMGLQVPGGMTGEQGKDIKEGAVELLEQPFGTSVRNVKAELERGFRFWDTVSEHLIPGRHYADKLFCRSAERSKS